MRPGWMILLCVTVLQARENPFVPAEEPKVQLQQTAGAAFRPAPQTNKRKILATASPSSPSKPEVVNFQNIRFLVQSDRIRIETKDTMIKDFRIAEPTRFILDFKSDADFPTRSRTLHTSPFKALRMGVHDGFYRVVIELGDKSGYEIHPYKYGYLLIRR